MKQRMYFYIFLLIIVSVVSIFWIGSCKKNASIIEGKGKKGLKNTKFGKFVKRMSKTISKKLGGNALKKKKRARRNRAREKRIKKYIFILNTLYDYSVNSIDYLQLLLEDLEHFYIENHTIVNQIWSNVRPETRDYLKNKYARFNQLKQKILFDADKNINVRKKKNVILVNNSMISVLSNDTFELPTPPVITGTNTVAAAAAAVAVQADVVTNSDFSVNVYDLATTFINQIRKKDVTNENFMDFFGNSDNGNNNIVAYYVNIYNNYANSALYQKYDEIENMFKRYEHFFDTQGYEIKKTIDGIKQNQTINNGETLYYINTKLEYFYKLLNTIEQKTDYGKQLSK
jgi:hypothetical protein